MVEVTSTETVQEPEIPPLFAGTLPPRSESVRPTIVIVPPQVVDAFAGLAKLNPAGRVSDQATGSVESVSAKLFGLYTTTVRVETPPAEMLMGLKLLLISASRLTWALTELAFKKLEMNTADASRTARPFIKGCVLPILELIVFLLPRGRMAAGDEI